MRLPLTLVLPRSPCVGIQYTIRVLVLVLGMVLKKMKIFNFFERAQKKSKLSENDTCVYLRLFRKYGAKLPSQKKVMRVQSR